MKTLAFVFVLSLIYPSTLHAQETKQRFTRADLLTAAREIIDSSRYAALITLDGQGRAQARTVDPFKPDENFIVWIGTNPRTRKVAAIRRNPRVTLYYFDRESEAYVTIHGISRLVNDAESKKKWFKDDWKVFYADREKDYTLIMVRPERLEVVNVKKGILGDSIKWLPPTVNFPKTKTRK